MKSSHRCSNSVLKPRITHTENKIKSTQIQQANFELLNRKGFLTDLNQIFHHRPNEQYAVVFLEIEHFHRIYERFSEQTQNQLLKKITSRIQSQLCEKDRFARQECDKFLICLSEFSSQKSLIKKIKSIIQAFQDGFIIHQQNIFLSINLGVSVYPTDAACPEKLLRFAYQACRSSKSMGENNYQLYDITNTHHTHYFEHIEEQLHFALQKKELSLLFQPQIDTLSGQIIGIEALLRWKNGKLGMVPPVDFIPIAEKKGLIFQITDWVIKNACQEFKNLPKTEQPIRMSINISAKEFQSTSPTILSRLNTILKEEHLRPSQIDLELTETNVMKNYKTAIPIMENLSKAGFHISCDDFGIGYSSLSHLKHLPIDTLKIDKSFVDNITQNLYDHAIVQAILLIADVLNFRVIAEGIENISQMNTLKTLGCHLIQGYYFSRPVSMNRIIEKILKR